MLEDEPSDRNRDESFVIVAVNADHVRDEAAATEELGKDASDEHDELLDSVFRESFTLEGELAVV